MDNKMDIPLERIRFELHLKWVKITDFLNLIFVFRW